MRLKYLPVVAIAIVLNVSGLGQIQTKLSGFLDEYPPLSPLENVPNALFWRASDVEKKYRALLIEQPEIFLDPKSAYKGIKPDALKMLADTLRDVVATEAAEMHPIVTEPGPDVIRIRIALSNLFLKKGGTLDWYQAVGPKSAYTMRAAIGHNVSLVEVVLEMEATDSTTGRRLGFVAAQSGQRKIKELDVPERESSWADLVRRLADLSPRIERNFSFLYK